MTAEVVVAAQFNGPARSGNGGYVSGLLGERLTRRSGPETAVTVTLRVPPPLGRPLQWRDEPGGAALLDGDTLVAEATLSDLADVDAVSPVTRAEAADAMAAYEGYVDHPFARCFTCGSARHDGDGLRVFTGPVGDGRVACPWAAHAAFGGEDHLLATAVTWALLDCPGGWAAGIKQRPMVLGRMTAAIARRPAVGEPCVVVGALRAVAGRKHQTATTVYDADGDLVGRAEHTWITIDAAAFS